MDSQRSAPGYTTKLFSLHGNCSTGSATWCHGKVQMAIIICNRLSNFGLHRVCFKQKASPGQNVVDTHGERGARVYNGVCRGRTPSEVQGQNSWLGGGEVRIPMQLQTFELLDARLKQH